MLSLKIKNMMPVLRGGNVVHGCKGGKGEMA